LNRESKARLAANLLVDSPWTADAFFDLLSNCRSRKSVDIEPLVSRLMARFPAPVSLNQLLGYLHQEEIKKELDKLSPSRLRQNCTQLATRLNGMRSSISPALAWHIPSIDSISQLADCLELSLSQLDWLAADYVDHYLIKGIRKKSGGVRIVEIPKTFMKRTQRHILWSILNWIPTHPAAHGFVAGRSVLSYVQPHVNKPYGMRMDLQDFFPSIDSNRVWGLFRSLGYPYAVTQLLTNLCTCWSGPSRLLEASQRIASRAQQQQLLSLHHRKHLPQGTPTSPALANLIAYRLDCRLAGLAKACDVTYTRYADDLLFSGGPQFARGAKSFATQVGAIVLEEGFRLNYRKTRGMHKSTRQSAGGIVINQVTNLRRSDFDKLKALLHNCLQHGAQSQNRDRQDDFRAHLLGRINWVGQLNSRRGDKLMRIFSQIQWD